MKHRAIIVGAGRIGAGYNWDDDAYTHAGAYRALKDRVELVGFVEPDLDRRAAAFKKWGISIFEDLPKTLESVTPDIVSICVQPEQQWSVLKAICGVGVKAVWCEKPFVSPLPENGSVIQVNYMRRADWHHRRIALTTKHMKVRQLFVIGKDDIHTRCHFEDLAKWWNAELHYMPVVNAPCSYIYREWNAIDGWTDKPFIMGGVDGGECFKGMLENLLDHLDKGTPLWSPAKGATS